MHTLEASKGTIFNFNSDFSGDVILHITEQAGTTREFEVPFDDLAELVAEYVRRKKIARLEDATDEIIFGI